MKLLNEIEMSEWAARECLKGNDTSIMRSLITKSKDAYWYCYYIRDIKEMWSKIKNTYCAYWYCIHVKDRDEVRKYVKKLNCKTSINEEKNKYNPKKKYKLYQYIT